MARRRKTNPAPLKILQKVLGLIGKPIYLLLLNLVLIILFILSLLGKFTSEIFNTRIKIKLPKIKISSLKIVKLKISLFKITVFKKLKKLKFPKFKFQLRYLFLIIPIFIVFLLFSFYYLILQGLPSPNDLVSRQLNVSTKIYDRNGELLYKIYGDQNRTPVTLDKIPESVKLATLAAEDAEFYTHPGISVRGIFRALVQNIKSGKLQGGSTITQQLVKNALLTPEQTLTRKIKEIILSFRVELKFTKDQILEMYLNEVPYGGTAYGIEAASEMYFGKKVQELNLAEASFLAGLPQSPTKFSPFGETPDLSISRQQEVLHLMEVNGYISKSQEENAIKTKLSFAPNKIEVKAPHFVMYIRSILVEKYGESMVARGGLEVKTTLDMRTQELAEKIVKEEVEKLKNLNVTNGAVVVLNPKNGEVLAMVGSKDYFDTKNDGNVNVVTRLRQPGSSIKIVNYAYALSKAGYTPSTIIDDSPIVYRVPGQPPYSPKNYDSLYRGRIPLRNAFSESRNIPAVKILASYGVSKMIEMGKNMGITSWSDPSRYGLSLTLGGGEVKLLDLAQVYATVANYGKRPEITPILKITDYKNRNIFTNTFDLDEQVLDPRVAFLLTDILSDNNARSKAFGTNSYLVIKNHPEVAVKTGTSNNLRDNLTIGYNQDFVVAVWVGNNDNSPMKRIASGLTGASPIWNKIMTSLIDDSPLTPWPVPSGLVIKNCESRNEWFLRENIDPNYCRKSDPSPSPNQDKIDNKEEEKVPRIL